MKVSEVPRNTVCRTSDGWWGVLGGHAGGGSIKHYRRFDAWDREPFRIASDEVVDLAENVRPMASVKSQVVGSMLASLFARLRQASPQL